MSKNQLKSLFKRKISKFWFSHYCSLCPSYSSLKFFSTTKLVPNKPHPFIIHSGTSESINHKSSTILKLLCGRYRLNSLKNKFNMNNSPLCQRCSMNSIEDIEHFLIICPYLDGARHYALLLWKSQLSNIVYNLFSSAMLYWPNDKLTHSLLDPMSQFQYSDISSHQNLEINHNNFSQDFTFSLHHQRQIFYGNWSKSWS